MSKPIQSIVYAMALVAVAELVLRIPLERQSAPAAPEAAETTSPDVRPESGETPDVPIYFALGSSRTKRGIDPDLVERALQQEGVADAWVGNVSYVGLTMPFLYRLYMDDIHPIVRDQPIRGVLAIEVRGSALNDSYMQDTERAYVTRGKFPEIEPLVLDPEKEGGDSSDAVAPRADEDGVAVRLFTGDFEGAAKLLMSWLRVAQGRDETLRWIERVRRSGAEPIEAVPDDEPESGGDASVSSASTRAAKQRILASRRGWTKGDRGYKALEANAVEGSLQVGKWRRRYQGELLVDYRVGGVQCDFLRRIIRQARNDGFVPVLYLMPITDIHRGFYILDDYERALEAARRVAEVENVPFIDLDTGHDYPESAFQDTHHLDPSVLDEFSDEFVRRVLLAPGRPRSAGR